MQAVFIPRAQGKPLTGWLLADPARPEHEVRFLRALLSARPTEPERAALLGQAEDLDRTRNVRLEILVHRDAR